MVVKEAEGQTVWKEEAKDEDERKKTLCRA